ncbi:MAG: hypothetical protein M3O46_08270, partial [Myxococcota bacterium]|nr:hypothetical protein [Myxococcota bacterium]
MNDMNTVTRSVRLAPLAAWLVLADCGQGSPTAPSDDASALDDASAAGPDGSVADSRAGGSSGSASGSIGSSSGSSSGSSGSGGSTGSSGSSGSGGSTGS